MNKKGINSTEIAKLAGVSRSTVSRVINNYPNVPEHTRDKVMNIIRQYHYVPNASARALVGKTNRTLGLFYMASAPATNDVRSNMLIVHAIESAAEAGYHMLTSIVHEPQQPESIKKVKGLFYQRLIEGGIFIGASSQEPVIEQLVKEGFFVAVLDYDPSGRKEPNLIIANVDHHLSIQLAIEYARSINHMKIGIFRGNQDTFSEAVKYQAFIKWMGQYSLSINDDWVIMIPDASSSEQGGYSALEAFLKRRLHQPTVWITTTDSIAFGVIRALQRYLFKVPDDISVVGIDDHVWSETFHPPLTTVRVKYDEMIQQLTSALIRQLEEPSDQVQHLTFQPELVVRDSCKDRIRF